MLNVGELMFIYINVSLQLASKSCVDLWKCTSQAKLLWMRVGYIKRSRIPVLLVEYRKYTDFDIIGGLLFITIVYDNNCFFIDHALHSLLNHEYNKIVFLLVALCRAMCCIDKIVSCSIEKMLLFLVQIFLKFMGVACIR